MERKIVQIAVASGSCPGDREMLFALANDGTAWMRVANMSDQSGPWVQMPPLPDREAE